MLILGIITGLVVLVFLVVIHELGHAIAAKRNGVVVEEFGIGFPPKAWGKKLKNGVLFTLNWLPLGGFVKLKGEHDAARRKGDYGAATFWQKTKILFAGVLVNWVAAVILLTILAWVGLPKIIPNQFSIASDTQTQHTPVQLITLSDNYPAKNAGLQGGDKILSVGGSAVPTTKDFIEATQAHRGERVTVEYERNGERHVTTVALRDADTAVFGSTLGQQERIQTTWSAPIVGVVTTFQYTWATLQGLGDLVVNFFGGLIGQLNFNEQARQAATEQLHKAGEGVAGPVGILGVIFPAASEGGPAQLLLLVAIISLTLAVMNALPIPALDGGRWFVTALFKLFKKPLRKDVEERIHGTGFLILMLLVIVITVADVTKFF